MTLMTSPRPTRSVLASLWAELTRVYLVKRQRKSLKSMDTAALRDLGLTRKQADAEAGRWFWDAPETWRL